MCPGIMRDLHGDVDSRASYLPGCKRSNCGMCQWHAWSGDNGSMELSVYRSTSVLLLGCSSSWYKHSRCALQVVNRCILLQEVVKMIEA